MKKTCPECRQPVEMAQTRRIYFNLSTTPDNLQSYVDYLDSLNVTITNKFNTATMQMKKIQIECARKLRDKDFEIQQLNEKLKDCEVRKLNAKIEKLKHKLKEVRYKRVNTILSILLSKFAVWKEASKQFVSSFFSSFLSRFVKSK